MSLNVIEYTDNVTQISAENLNDIQDEVIRLDEDKFDKSGGILSGSMKLNATSKGYYLTDKTGVSYPGIYDNGKNLWIGSAGTEYINHVGKTYISTGYNPSTGLGYDSLYAAVPNSDNNGTTNYQVWHSGHVNYNKLYPVGSCYMTSTKTNPGTMFPGTTWTLIDKCFAPKEENNTSIFTINTTNTTSLGSCWVIYGGHSIYLRINVTNKVSYNNDGTTIHVGTINFNELGVSQAGLSRYTSEAYCDAAQGSPVFTVSNTTGKLNIADTIGPAPSTSTGLSYYFSIRYTFHHNYMLDDYCNQFIWKRTE